MTRSRLRLDLPDRPNQRAPLDEGTVQRLHEAARSVRSRRNPSGRAEVYVALLKPRGSDAGHRFYVGSTGIGSAERYRQHEAGTKAVRKRIKNAGLGLLPQLTEHLNPMLSMDARIVEDQLHLALEEAGFVVHGDRLREQALGSAFDAALTYAVNLHRRQVRKGTSTPYASHLLAVCSLVLEDGGSETEAMAAVLHDAVEDQGGLRQLQKIQNRFGVEVARLVEALSDATPARGEEKAPWRERKGAYLARLKNESEAVLRISLADKLHNARSIEADFDQIGDSVYDRFNAPKGGQGRYYRELAQIFGERIPDSRNLPAFTSVVARLFEP
jgi:hypothetical protein